MTNADHVRKMTDEELAKLLVFNPWMKEKSAIKWLKERQKEERKTTGVNTVETCSIKATTLETCPHCGGKPTTEVFGSYVVVATILCPQCGAAVHVKCVDTPPTFSGVTDAMLEATRKWNARTNKNKQEVTHDEHTD